MSENEQGSTEEISEEELQKQLEQQKNDLYKDFKQGLSLVSRTYNGSYAYLKLNYQEKELVNTFELIKNFEHIRFLDLSNNKLTSLDDIINLKYLQKINISQNEFKNFEIFKKEDDIKFDYLEELNISKNKLKELCLENCKILKRLFVQDNELEKLELIDCNEIELLEVRGNKLKQILNLDNQNNLQQFYGANNKFDSLEQFRNNQQLKVLHLRQNYINGKDQIQRDNFQSLQILNVRQNLINNIEYFQFVKYLSNLQKINFMDNPSQKENESNQDQDQEQDQEQEKDQDIEQEQEEIIPITQEQFIQKILIENDILEKSNLKHINKTEVNEELIESYKEEKEQLINQTFKIQIKKIIMNQDKVKAYRELVDKVWTLYDKNGDGVLQKSEAIDVFRDILNRDKVCELTLEQLVKDADLNGDGVIDKEELFQHFIKKRSEFM